MKLIIRALLFCLILSVGHVQAKLYLSVHIYNKKGIDLGVTLTSEFHSQEEVFEGQSILLKMKNGIKVLLQPEFEGVSEGIGPSENILIAGTITDPKGEIIKKWNKEELKIPLGERRELSQEKDNQLVEIKIQPEIK